MKTVEVWQNNEDGDTMFLSEEPTGWYAHGTRFDFERPTHLQATEQLKKWNYEFIGFDKL